MKKVKKVKRKLSMNRDAVAMRKLRARRRKESKASKVIVEMSAPLRPGSKADLQIQNAGIREHNNRLHQMLDEARGVIDKLILRNAELIEKSEKIPSAFQVGDKVFYAVRSFHSGMRSFVPAVVMAVEFSNHRVHYVVRDSQKTSVQPSFYVSPRTSIDLHSFTGEENALIDCGKIVKEADEVTAK